MTERQLSGWAGQLLHYIRNGPSGQCQKSACKIFGQRPAANGNCDRFTLSDLPRVFPTVWQSNLFESYILLAFYTSSLFNTWPLVSLWEGWGSFKKRHEQRGRGTVSHPIAWNGCCKSDRLCEYWWFRVGDRRHLWKHVPPASLRSAAGEASISCACTHSGGSDQAHQAYGLHVQRSELQPRRQVFVRGWVWTMLRRALHCFLLAGWLMGSSGQ